MNIFDVKTLLHTFLLGSVLLLGMGVPTSAALSSNYTIEQKVLSTDQVPGGDTMFYDLHPPSINAHGAIAFNDGLGEAIYTTGHGAAVGPLVRAVGMGDSAPGLLGSFLQAYDPFLNDDGSIVFRGEGNQCDRGIYLLLSTGEIKLIADGSTFEPGTSNTLWSCGLTEPVASNGGHIVFTDLTFGSQLPTTGVYRADFDSMTGAVSLSELVNASDGFTELPGAESPIGYSVNDAGIVAMTISNNTDGRSIYVAKPDGSFTRIVKIGDPAPGGGTFTSFFASPSINNTGEIAFVGDGNGIYIAGGNGVMTKVIGTEAEMPNHPGTFLDNNGSIFDVHLADDGTIIFRAQYSQNKNGVPMDFYGIYKISGAGLEVVFDQYDGLMVNGQHKSLIDRNLEVVCDMFLAPRFVNDSSEVAFQQYFGLDCSNNGIFVAKIEPPPDLIIGALSTAATAAVPGGSVAVTTTVMNQGAGPAGASVVGFRLSSDTTYGNGDDIVLTPTRSVGPVAAGASSAASTTLTVPAATSPGAYYLCAMADANTSITEIDETNNSSCISFSIQAAGQPDLLLTDVTPNATTVNAGTTLSVTGTVVNEGVTTAGTSRIAYHLSSDSIYGNGDDIAISTSRVVPQPFVAGANSTATTSLAIPGTTPGGTYYLCAMADSLNQVVESDETNNSLCSTQPVTVPLPDLLITHISTTSLTATAGSSLRLTFTITNQGGSKAGPFVTNFHLSTDTTYGNDDDISGNQMLSLPSLGVGASFSNASYPFVVPKSTPAGTYYVCGMTDVALAVAESDEANNTNCTLTTIRVQ